MDFVSLFRSGNGKCRPDVRRVGEEYNLAKPLSARGMRTNFDQVGKIRAEKV